MTAFTVTTRPATPADRAFVLETAARLAAFDLPDWRTPAEIRDGEARTLRAWFDGAVEGTLLVAEGEREPLGFVFLERQTDYFTLEEHGHVGILAVTSLAEGRGAGKALLAAGEEWARTRGYRRLTLNVFDRNARARAVYDHLGYQPETIRYLKRI